MLRKDSCFLVRQNAPSNHAIQVGGIQTEMASDQTIFERTPEHQALELHGRKKSILGSIRNSILGGITRKKTWSLVTSKVPKTDHRLLVTK